MPRKYKKKPGSRNYRNYTEETLLKAVADCNRIPYKDVSKIYGIPIRKLRNKVNGLHPKKVGGQLAVCSDFEDTLLKYVLKCADYGMPLTQDDIKFIMKGMLDNQGIKVAKFKSNLPGPDWVKGFFLRHKDELCQRNCQNIKRTRAEVGTDQIERYFNNLQSTLDGIPPDNILNYDETNLSDQPGQKKCAFRRGTKYPERVINFSKGNISIMFSGSATGTLLPPYIIYKSEHLWNSWCERGPTGARFGRSKSGWMDGDNFLEWFTTIVVPWAKKREGTKALIGDNLSSHISPKVIEKCEELNIAFILLPPNATDKLQPLDVSYFAPLKKAWRKILEDYRNSNPSSTSLNKSVFPMMLNNLIEALGMRSSKNLIPGFKACGIYPLDRQAVLKKFPDSDKDSGSADASSASDAVLTYLRTFKYSPEGIGSNKADKKRKRTKLLVSPGKSVSVINSSPQPSTSSAIRSPQPTSSAHHSSQPMSSANQSLLLTSSADLSPQPMPSASVNSIRRALLPSLNLSPTFPPQHTASDHLSASDCDSDSISEHFASDMSDDNDEEWVPRTKKHRK